MNLFDNVLAHKDSLKQIKGGWMAGPEYIEGYWKNTVGDLSEAKYFDFTDLIPLYRSHRDSKGLEWERDIHNARPPFEKTFIVFQYNDAQQLGILLSRITYERPNAIKLMLNQITDAGRELWAKEIALAVIAGRDHVNPPIPVIYHTSIFYQAKNGELHYIPAGPIVCMDELGRPLSKPFLDMNILTAAREMSPEDADVMQAEWENISINTLPVWFYLQLLNCKNVETVRTPPDAKLNRARIRRGKLPLSEKYTLRVNLPGMRRTGAAVESKGDSEGKRRQHFVRGHLATYTKEKPLFGKHVGTFWIPAQIRGSVEVGKVEKDYKGKATA